jgi:hypothetical protein
MYIYIYIYICIYIDTRTTQWEDPRMSNPQIAGPVSFNLSFKIKIKSFIIYIIYHCRLFLTQEITSVNMNI